MVASGNDFVVIDRRKEAHIKSPASLAVKICDRKFGAGADGLLLIETSKKADIKMRIFNPDGSEPDMCANGVRCAGLWAKLGSLKIETRAGIIFARVNKDKVKIKMTEPKNLSLGSRIKLCGRAIKVNFINTGVPHAVVFVEGVDEMDVVAIGRKIRFHKRFQPQGVNVNFVQLIGDSLIKLRTYERGVEDETLACGTGMVASALIYASGNIPGNAGKIKVHTQSGEILSVEFQKKNSRFTPLEISKHRRKKTRFLTGFKNVWLEGKSSIVYSGVYYV